MRRHRYAATLLALFASSPGAMAQDSDVQKQLANPIASLTLVPIQVNYDRGIGPAGDGYKITTNIQPVIPVKLNSDWTLVSRTIIPVIGQIDVFPGAGDQFGLGDTLQSFFLVPKTVDGFTWGAGPVFLWRTGTDSLLSAGKWAAGPTAVALQQTGPWTVGLLANHVWSFEGDDNRADVSSSFIQPFLSYAAAGGWTYTLNTESTYNWVAQTWSVPINLSVAKLSKFGAQPVSLTAGVKYWATSPENQGPEGWGGRLGITFIFP